MVANWDGNEAMQTSLSVHSPSPEICLRSCYFRASIRAPAIGKKSQMKEHHDDSHSLATFIGVGVALGAGIGAAFGVAFGNIALGTGLGPAFGIAIAVAIWSVRQTPMDRSDPKD